MRGELKNTAYAILTTQKVVLHFVRPLSKRSLRQQAQKSHLRGIDDSECRVTFLGISDFEIRISGFYLFRLVQSF